MPSWSSIGKVWSLSEVEVCGFRVLGKEGIPNAMRHQLPIFRDTRDRFRYEDPTIKVWNRKSWWLRDSSKSSTTGRCCVNMYGNISDDYTTACARPCFLLGVETESGVL